MFDPNERLMMMVCYEFGAFLLSIRCNDHTALSLQDEHYDVMKMELEHELDGIY